MKRIFDVVEIASGNVVSSFENKLEAKKYRKLNNPTFESETGSGPVEKFIYKISKGPDHILVLMNKYTKLNDKRSKIQSDPRQAKNLERVVNELNIIASKIEEYSAR